MPLNRVHTVKKNTQARATTNLCKTPAAIAYIGWRGCARARPTSEHLIWSVRSKAIGSPWVIRIVISLTCKYAGTLWIKGAQQLFVRSVWKSTEGTKGKRYYHGYYNVDDSAFSWDYPSRLVAMMRNVWHGIYRCCPDTGSISNLLTGPKSTSIIWRVRLKKKLM